MEMAQSRDNEQPAPNKQGDHFSCYQLLRYPNCGFQARRWENVRYPADVSSSSSIRPSGWNRGGYA